VCAIEIDGADSEKEGFEQVLACIWTRIVCPSATL
jgi:hypothetical protein